MLRNTFAPQNLVAVAPGATWDTTGLEILGVQLFDTVAWVGVTVAFQATIDGTNWVALAGIDTSGTARTTGVTSAATPGMFVFDVRGLMGVRMNVSARTSGTVTVSASGFVDGR